MQLINETHDPSLTSWVTSANGHPLYPIQNLPFAIMRKRGSEQLWRGGVAIGDKVLDLAALADRQILTGKAQQAVEAAKQSTLNQLMGMGAAHHSALRLALSRTLREGAAEQESIADCLMDSAEIEFNMPCTVGDYTDFYTSIHHATAVGKLFRPDNPLLPNYRWVPIGYHGRSSTIDVSGQSFPRPVGQTRPPGQETPNFGPCKRMDYELEMGIFIGEGNALGQAISIDKADDHIFGFCLLNDWSARDIQAWEYQPLGPFLAKNFASTISPWVVTLEALAPYRVAFTRPAEDPQPMDYLQSELNNSAGGFDIELECLIHTAQMQQQDAAPKSLSRSNFRHSYWTPAQLVTHHSVGGCKMNPGDMLGSGTQSGPNAEEAGSLLELSQGGKVPVDLGNGETRVFLEDGDTVIMRAVCQKPGTAPVGFGEVVGTVLPAIE